MGFMDPDAPWWVNVLTTVLVALISGVVVWLGSRRGVKKATAATNDAVAKVLDHVANNHKVGLRDDLDEKFEGLSHAIGTLADDVGGLHSELRDAREDVNHLQRDIEGIRTDNRRARRRESALTRVVATALDRAQGVIDEHHPGVQLRDPDPSDT